MSKCFIVGRGSSLAGFDFNKLKNSDVIAVNEAIEVVPWAKAMVAIDFEWAFLREQKNLKRSGQGYWLPIIKDTPIIVDHVVDDCGGYNVQVMLRSKFTGFEFKPNRVATSSNSGYMAINVAYHLGYRDIYLLGYDMGKINGQRYFDEPNYVEYKGQTPHYDHTLRMFDGMAMELMGSDVKIYNCSEHSLLECFPKIKLEDVRFD